MAANLWKVASSNAFNTTLSGNISAGDTSIGLTSVTGLNTSGGVLTIDRQDVNNVNTPSLREYISYTGISSTTLTGVTRGLGTSTAQSHNANAKVEETLSVSHWNDLISALLNVLTTAGALDTTKVVDLSTVQTLTNKVISGGTISGTIAGSPTFSGTLAFSPTKQTVTAMSAQALDGSLGNVFTRTLAANETFTQSNFSTGQFFLVEVLQGSGTTYTVTWFSGVTWRTAGGTAPVQTTTSGGKSTYGFRCTGTNTFDGYLVGQN